MKFTPAQYRMLSRFNSRMPGLAKRVEELSARHPDWTWTTCVHVAKSQYTTAKGF